MKSLKCGKNRFKYKTFDKIKGFVLYILQLLYIITKVNYSILETFTISFVSTK
jgi:hypothetical protein